MGASARAVRVEHRPHGADAARSPDHRVDSSGRPDLRGAGNLAVQRLRTSRLAVGAPGDAAEREADLVARQVVGGMPVGGLIARMCTGCAEDEEKEQAPATVARTLARPGSPLPQPVRRTMEASFGRPFGDVRLHADAQAAESAAAIDARAYTSGNDVVLGAGTPPLASPGGREVLAHELTHVVQQTGRPGPVRRDLLDDASSALASVVDTVTETASDIGSAVTGVVSDVGTAVAGALTDLGVVVGFPAPADGSPASLRLILDVAENPLVSGVAGTLLPAGTVPMLRGTLPLLEVAWDVLQHPEPYIEQIQTGFGEMLAGAGPLATQTATAAVPSESAAEGGALDCVWRHLEPKLDYVYANGWTVLKGMGWDLLWPWPGVAEDFVNAWTHIKSLGSHLWQLELGAAQDDYLAVLRYVNGAAGRLYGWFFVASVLGSAILGGIAGAGVGGATTGPGAPAGATLGIIPGAAAGAASGLALAAAVGVGLLISTAAIEGASIAKAAFNLASSGRTPEQYECDCEIIASSSLTLGITGALAVFGGLAARFGKAMASRIFNRVFRRPIKRGQGEPGERTIGDVLADRWVLGELVKARFNQWRVAVTDALSKADNFAGLDVLIDSEVRVTSQVTGAALESPAALRGAFANRETIRVEVTGGNFVQVKAHGPVASLVKMIREEIRELAIFTTGKYGGNTVVVTAPAQRTLVVFLQEAMSAADEAVVRAAAARRGVVLELIVGSATSSHPTVVALDAMPAILAELGADAGDELSEPPAGSAVRCP